MAARWVDLLQRLERTLDQATDELSQADRDLFMDAATRALIVRRTKITPMRVGHPRPGPTPDAVRDPTGEDTDFG